MKVAIISYKIMFDPSEAWSNGHQFESQFADFFAAHGFEAQFVIPAGGSGDRVIYLERVYTPEAVAKQIKQGDTAVSNAPKQIKQIQAVKPTASFKHFQSRGVPKSIVNQEKRPPKTTFRVSARQNRQKVRVP